MNPLTFRDQKIFEQIRPKVILALEKRQQELGRKLRWMEVCGTHTTAFSKSGLRDLLSPYLELISGPGCPVCVTDQSQLDQMIAFAEQDKAIVATFGDLVKVPGSRSSLDRERANGAKVKVVFSPSEAVELAKQHPDKKIVFLGVGFETTAPSIALSIKKAVDGKVNNYFVYSAHKRTPPPIQVLLDDPAHQLDGLILPGHVSVIIGRRGWRMLEGKNIPAVIGGFEPIDLMTSAYWLAKQMKLEKRSVINNYQRFVREEGNRKAQELLQEVFCIQSADWRGFGSIPDSGLELRPCYRSFDAKEQFPIDSPGTKVVSGCICGEVVKGKVTPNSCAHFAKACTPENPLGPCMVSTEGTCACYYQSGMSYTSEG